MARYLVLLFVSAGLIAIAQGHGGAGSEKTYKPQEVTIGKVDLQWNYDEKSDMLHFKVVGETTGWLAIGFSYTAKNMQNYDIALGGVKNNNESYLYDLFSTANGRPPRDAQQDFNLTSATESGGKTILEFHRKRQTGDAKDIQFEHGKPVYLMWALHSDDATDGNTGFSYHGSSNRGHTVSRYDLLSKSIGCTHKALLGASLLSTLAAALNIINSS